MKKTVWAVLLMLLVLPAVGCGPRIRSEETAALLSGGVYTLRYTAEVSGVPMEGTLIVADGKMDETVTQGGLSIRTVFDGTNWYSVDSVNRTYAAAEESTDALGLRALGALTYSRTEQVPVGEEILACEVYDGAGGQVRFYIRDKAVAWMEIERRTASGAMLTAVVQIASLDQDTPTIVLPADLKEVPEAEQTEKMFATAPEYPEEG